MRRAVDILRTEIDLTLAAVGCATMAEVGSHLLIEETDAEMLREALGLATQPRAVV